MENTADASRNKNTQAGFLLPSCFIENAPVSLLIPYQLLFVASSILFKNLFSSNDLSRVNPKRTITNFFEGMI